MKNFNLLIDGHLVGSTSKLEVVNPATGAVFASCPKASLEQLDEVIAAATRAQKEWADSDQAERHSSLSKLADRIFATREDIAKTLSCEQGKTIDAALFEVDAAIAFTQYFSEYPLPEPVIIDDNDTQTVWQHRKPIGVIACIMPWNFPFLQAIYKLAPGVLMGNAVILKPSPTTPLTTLMIGEIAADLFPAGVVNVLTDENELGPILSAHPAIGMVSLTGSTQTGKAVMASASQTLKRVTLELGGNDAAILLEDVDLDVAIPNVFATAFIVSAQVCIAIKRLYVPEALYDEVCNRLAELANSAVIGNGLDSGVEYGPLQNRAQLEKYKHYLAIAKRDGQVITDSKVPEGDGFFAPFCIVRDIDDSSPLVTEEPFVPILPILKYTNIDDAITRANSTEFGLGGSIWSADTKLATQLASKLESGTAWVNKHCDFGPHIPFGGIKQSGIGVEFGPEGIKELTNIQVISIAH